jgi:hypothetical protein
LDKGSGGENGGEGSGGEEWDLDNPMGFPQRKVVRRLSLIGSRGQYGAHAIDDEFLAWQREHMEVTVGLGEFGGQDSEPSSPTELRSPELRSPDAADKGSSPSGAAEASELARPTTSDRSARLWQVREGDADNPGKDIGSSSSSSSSSSSGGGSGSVAEPPLFTRTTPRTPKRSGSASSLPQPLEALDLEDVETAAKTNSSSSSSSSSAAGAAVAQAAAVRGAPEARAAIGKPAAAPAATVASVAALEAAVLRLRAELRAVVGPSPHEQRHALARHALPYADASELAAAVRANVSPHRPAYATAPKPGFFLPLAAAKSSSPQQAYTTQALSDDNVSAL